MKKIALHCFVLLVFSQVFAQNKLPRISLKNTEGKRIDISKINTNNVTVFSFWATWCVPCINELDAISEDYSDWQNETNVEIIAVSIDDTRTASRVKPLVNGKSWDYQVLYDTNQEFKRAVNASSIPYLIIVKNNKIVYSHFGYTPGSEMKIYEKIKQFAN
jgi:peroxiredoxin